MKKKQLSKQEDTLYRYLFENRNTRGELVQVNETYQQLLSGHNYPPVLAKLLGELLVATSLLTALIKLDGDITVQLQGDGPLKLAVINGNNHQQMRGVARVQGEISETTTLRQMLGNGYLVITIMPKQGERYQGIVAIEHDDLTQCLENYFLQSEQLVTRLYIKVSEIQAAGMLLQILPSSDNEAVDDRLVDSEDFEHISMLTQTIKADELFSLTAEQVLHRLYHQEQITLFEPQRVTFKCHCSKQRCAEALATLPQEELEEMLQQDQQINIHCDYCGKSYLFTAEEILQSDNSTTNKDNILH